MEQARPATQASWENAGKSDTRHISFLFLGVNRDSAWRHRDAALGSRKHSFYHGLEAPASQNVRFCIGFQALG